MLKSYKIDIRGTVQAVGFRPFVYQLAKRHNLYGTISNGSQGVEIFINASSDTMERFISDIKLSLPPLAQIDTIDIEVVSPKAFDEFKIIQTQDNGKIEVNIPPDITICKECEMELFDRNNRRYMHPFINCTNCGVRYSIIYDLPYDRDKTSMRSFEMCKECEIEYNNPQNRRYHAQPIGCWECGARLELIGEKNLSPKDIVDRAVSLLREGNILAIKGVGGYHLICDSTNNEAIKKLRERKKRPTKPFAIMTKDIDMANKLAYINPKEKELLLSKERPIVLLDSKIEQNLISPHISRLGVFLPYTPLHLLIITKLNRPLVATSANISDEPIATTRESIKRLSSVYDYLLEHNREIVNGCDDSVVMVVNQQKITIRRARGYAPVAITLPFRLPQKVLAVGANQKSTVAIGFDNKIILSPHIGDLNSIESLEYYRENIEILKRVYHFTPNIIADDKHPHYESSKYAKASGMKTQEVQHHYAHILSVIAEKKINQKVLGVAFDGTGYGDDGKLWGGEFMICDYREYRRVAHFNYFRLLGGAKAIKEPKRVALSLLFDIYGKNTLTLDNHTTKAFSPNELKSQYIMWQKALNSPLCSSVGRLFDAVASLTGVCQVMSFEGESGMMMEEFYDDSVRGFYPFEIKEEEEIIDIIDILPMIEAITKEPNPRIAISKFFNTLVEIIYTLYKKYKLPLVLSGGVFQNRVLLRLIFDRTPDAIISNEYPPNDGGIALGQVVATLKNKNI